VAHYNLNITRYVSTAHDEVEIDLAAPPKSWSRLKRRSTRRPESTMSSSKAVAAQTTAFVTAATWPDAIKKRGSGYVDEGENPSTPGSTKNVGYADNLTRSYTPAQELIERSVVRSRASRQSS
jgi:hypothetical protein